jgi:excisionase family DNA binding protein
MAHAGIYARNRRDLSDSKLSGNDSDSILTINQVSARLSCSRAHVYNMIESGRLPAFKIGEKRGFRIYERDVNHIMSEQMAG